MDYHEFLHDLHFDIDKVRPTHVAVDWEDAPLPYKIYRGVNTVPLPREVALCLDEPPRSSNQVRLRDVGNLLWYTYGLTQVSQTHVPLFASEDDAVGGSGNDEYEMQLLRRFVPSGGGLYPSELYVYLKIDELETGVYHYDAAHHQLVLLRQGEFDEYLRQALFQYGEAAECFAVVFVSCLFWKNFFKYHNFSYRLQGLDAGALIGQLLEVSKRLQFSPLVHYHFLDEALNHLLGLVTDDESVYCVIEISDASESASLSTPLSTSDDTDAREGTCPKEGGAPSDGIFQSDSVLQSDDVRKRIPPIHHDYYLKSRNILPYPDLVAMNQAALHDVGPLSETGPQTVPCKTGEPRVSEAHRVGTSHLKGTRLPDVDEILADFTGMCRRRYSPGFDFRMRPIGMEKLAVLLQGTMSAFEYKNDLEVGGVSLGPRVSLFVCIHGVEGIAGGAYQYDSDQHRLLLRQSGDFRMDLQLGLSLPNVNLFDVPLCFHIVGSREHLTSRFGFRGYRIEQMEAGALLQRLLLCASAVGMAGHPLLGYEAAVCDDIYRINEAGKTCLIQVPIGFAQAGPRLQGPLFG